MAARYMFYLTFLVSVAVLMLSSTTYAQASSNYNSTIAQCEQGGGTAAQCQNAAAACSGSGISPDQCLAWCQNNQATCGFGSSQQSTQGYGNSGGQGSGSLGQNGTQFFKNFSALVSWCESLGGQQLGQYCQSMVNVCESNNVSSSYCHEFVTCQEGGGTLPECHTFVSTCETQGIGYQQCMSYCQNNYTACGLSAPLGQGGYQSIGQQGSSNGSSGNITIGGHPAYVIPYVPGQGFDQVGTVNFVKVNDAQAPPTGQGYFGDAPDIIRLPNGQYRMYYQGGNLNNQSSAMNLSILSLTSNDDVHWSIDPGASIPYSSAYSGEKLEFASVVRGSDGKYHMVYQVGGASGNSDYFAISNDSLVWAAQTGSISNAGRATVEQVNGTYYMYYSTAHALQGAKSNDFSNWQLLGNITNIGVDPGGLINVNGTYYMFLEGWANSPAPSATDPEDMFMIASNDGIHWSNNAYRVMLTYPNGTAVDLDVVKFGFQNAATVAPNGTVMLYLNPLTNQSGGNGQAPAPMYALRLVSPLPKASTANYTASATNQQSGGNIGNIISGIINAIIKFFSSL